MDEIRERLEAIEIRKQEIRTLLINDKDANLDDLENELRDLDIEKKELERRERVLKAAEQIKNGESGFKSLGTVEDLVEGRGKTIKNKDYIELRKGDKLKDFIDIPKEERGLDLGKYIRGIATGNWKNADKERRAMTTTATGTLIPKELSAEIVDLARNKSLFTLGNVPVVPMDSNNLTISRLKTDPIFKFKKEGEEADSESFLEFDSVELKAKTIYGYAYVSLEALSSSHDLEGTIMNAFSEALAQGIDNAMLYGQYNDSTKVYDEFAPSGVLNNENINTITAVADEGYDSFIKAMGKIRSQNGEASSVAFNSFTEEMLNILKNQNGDYINPPVAFTNIPNKIVTNQLKHSADTGDDALVFDSESMLIGMGETVRIEMFRDSDKCIKNGLVGFRVYEMVDCIIKNPRNICKITGIK